MKKFMTIALALLAFTACQQKEKQEPLSPGKLCVEPLISKATEVNFETGDKIGLTVVTDGAAENYATNACLTYAGDAFSGDLIWYANAYTKSSLYAYYPYSEAGAPTSYTLPADQSEGILTADLMAATKTDVLPTVNAVTMVFKHLMTKIVINVDNQSGSEIESIALVGGSHSAALDLAAMTITAGEPASDAVVTACETVAGKTWNVIVVPQTVSFKVSFTLSNKNIIVQPLASMALKSGGQYTIDARLLADNAEVTATGEIQNWTDEGNISFEGESENEYLPVTFTEYEGYFVYDGVEYKTVKLADGNTWMAENLRFIPRGRTVSSDPVEDAGIWYPAANADKQADPALAQTFGLLYNAATAFGVEEITKDNASTFEGCQGICPEGWHIPTVAEMTGLVGHCSNSDLINTSGAYYDSTVKGASLAALKEAGWEWQFASCRNKTNTTATGSYLSTTYNDIYGVMSYIIGSTKHAQTENTDGSLKNVQYYYMMPTYNSSNEKVTVAYGNFLSGASIRCVKDKE